MTTVFYVATVETRTGNAKLRCSNGTRPTRGSRVSIDSPKWGYPGGVIGGSSVDGHPDPFPRPSRITNPMTHAFSMRTRHCLSAAGWREGRTTRTHHWESLLKSAGNPIHPAVLTFLREFGGLKVFHPHRVLPHKYDYFHLSPSAATKHFPIEEDGLEDANERVGKPLCAVGTASNDYLCLLMDADGKIYAATDDLLFLAGNTPIEALEALCADALLPSIP